MRSLTHDRGFQPGVMTAPDYKNLDKTAGEIAQALDDIEAVAPRELWAPGFRQ